MCDTYLTFEDSGALKFTGSRSNSIKKKVETKSNAIICFEFNSDLKQPNYHSIDEIYLI